MAYEVLARKWRPQQFVDLVGQEHVARTLTNAIKSNRIAHAYLFVGPRGIGKTSSARILAKALNCAGGPTATPCDQCDSCREIIKGNSMDVVEIDGASNTGVDHIRDLRESVLYAPVRGPYKIYIIDEVHMLTASAFNALLKTLEEPPKHVIFIFATTEPQKVLPTIVSRCQRFDLRPISTRQIVEHLRKIAEAEKVEIDDDALLAVARGAEGGMRDAESALDQLIAFCGGKIREEDVISVFGLMARQTLERLIDAMLAGDIPEAIRLVNELDRTGKDIQRVLVELLQYLRNMLVLSYSEKETDYLDITDGQLRKIKQQIAQTDSARILSMINILVEADDKMRRALSRCTLLEVAVIQCARATTVVPVDQVIQNLLELKKQLGGTSVVSPPPKPSPAPRRQAPTPNPPQKKKLKTPSEITLLRNNWGAIKDHVEHHASQHAATCLRDAEPLSVAGSKVTIGFDPEFATKRDEMSVSANRQALANAIGEQLGRTVQLDLEVLPGKEFLPSDVPMKKVKDTASNDAAGQKVKKNGQSDLSRKARDKWMKNEKVLLALEMFNGDIVDIRM